MSPEDEKYYENYLGLFIHPGWDQFIEEINSILDSYRIEDIKDEKHLAYTKGERAALYRVRRFANGIKANYESITEKQQ